jgi:hypothetical protein
MTTQIHQLAAGSSSGIDLVTPWNKFFGLFPSGILALCSILGIGCIIYAIGKFLWSKFRQGGGGGGGGRGNTVGWALLFGVVLVSPQIVMPVILWILDQGLIVGFKLKDMAASA